MTEIICALIAAIATIIVAYQNTRTSRYIKISEARAERRAHESRLAMELMYSTCNLAMLTASHMMQMIGQANDAEMKTAMKKAEEAQDNYVNFVRDEAAKNFAKM